MAQIKVQLVGYLSFLILGLACGKNTSDTPAQSNNPIALNKAEASPRGTLLSVSPLTRLSREALEATFRAYGITPRYGVEISKIVYRTEDPEGRAIDASGIIIKPDVDLPAYPWLSLQHGTITAQADAPSASPWEGLVEGSQGFYTVVPDYLGFGTAQGEIHPYMIAEAYADAGVDMLRAVRQHTSQQSLQLGPLFLKGYSEGGYATLALQRALETDYQAEFSVKASAPGAGPYDLEITSRILLTYPTNNPVNLPFVVLSYERWLGKGNFALDRVLKPDLNLMRDLFSGAYSNQDIYDRLSPKTDELFQAELLQDYLSESPQLLESQQLATWLRGQSLHKSSWTPRSPTRFYHCRDDEAVPVEATLSAVSAFKERNAADVEAIVIDSPDANRPYTHVNCPGIFAALSWFQTKLQN